MSSAKWRLLRLGLNVLTHRHISEYSLQMQVSPMPLLDDTYTYGSVYFLLMARICLHFAPILSRHFFQIVSNSEDVAICCPKWRRISLLILSKTSVFNGDNPSRPVRFEAASTSDPKYKSARRQLIPVATRSKTNCTPIRVRQNTFSWACHIEHGVCRYCGGWMWTNGIRCWAVLRQWRFHGFYSNIRVWTVCGENIGRLLQQLRHHVLQMSQIEG